MAIKLGMKVPQVPYERPVRGAECSWSDQQFKVRLPEPGMKLSASERTFIRQSIEAWMTGVSDDPEAA